jgi:hypothetical protein
MRGCADEAAAAMTNARLPRQVGGCDDQMLKR